MNKSRSEDWDEDPRVKEDCFFRDESDSEAVSDHEGEEQKPYPPDMMRDSFFRIQKENTANAFQLMDSHNSIQGWFHLVDGKKSKVRLSHYNFWMNDYSKILNTQYKSFGGKVPFSFIEYTKFVFNNTISRSKERGVSQAGGRMMLN